MAWRDLRRLAVRCRFGRQVGFRLGDGIQAALGRILSDKHTLLAGEPELRSFAAGEIEAIEDRERSVRSELDRGRFQTALGLARQLEKQIMELRSLRDALREERLGREELRHWKLDLGLEPFAGELTVRVPVSLLDRSRELLQAGHPHQARFVADAARREIGLLSHPRVRTESDDRRRREAEEIKDLATDKQVSALSRLLEAGHVELGRRLADDLRARPRPAAPEGPDRPAPGLLDGVREVSRQIALQEKELLQIIEPTEQRSG